MVSPSSRESTVGTLDATVFTESGHSKSTFTQDSQVLTPSPPLLVLVRFWAPPPPPPKLCSFWLELTLSFSISILVTFRENKFMTSTSILPQWNLYKVDTICINDKSVRFMAGKSHHMPFTDETEYYNLSW